MSGVPDTLVDFHTGIDLEANCEFWKGLGECVKNAGYMINHCPVSCETCELRAAPRARCLERFPDWLRDESERVDWLVDPVGHGHNLTMRLRENYQGFVVLSEDPFVYIGRENMTTRRRSCATGASGSWPCGGSVRERRRRRTACRGPDFIPLRTSCLVIPRVDAAHSSSGPPPRSATRCSAGTTT